MEENDLIKKLENLDLPEIKIPSYQKKLRTALVSSNYFEKKTFFDIFKKPILLAVPSFALILILGIVVLQPKLTEAKVLNIAKVNPEIKKLIETQNMNLGEVKVKDGKAYVLLNVSSPEETNPSIEIEKTDTNQNENIEGAVIEINLEQNEVTNINPISGEDINPLDSQEKESAQKIAEAEEIVKDILPKEATIEKIQSSLSEKIEFVEKDDEIEVKSSPKAEKKAKVHYTSDGKKWVVEVNLDEKRVEKIEYSSDNKSEKD